MLEVCPTNNKIIVIGPQFIVSFERVEEPRMEPLKLRLQGSMLTTPFKVCEH